jgi:hypothetical protein
MHKQPKFKLLAYVHWQNFFFLQEVVPPRKHMFPPTRLVKQRTLGSSDKHRACLSTG